MIQSKKKENILRYKLIYTVLILLVYLLGKSLPLYMVDLSAYVHTDLNAEDLLVQSISGDIYQCSLFALGISPYMIASVIVQMISSFKRSDFKAKVSPKKMNRMTLALTLMLAMFQAFVQVQNLQFRVVGDMLILAQIVAVFEMIAGAMIILWLSSRNKHYGIG